VKYFVYITQYYSYKVEAENEEEAEDAAIELFERQMLRPGGRTDYDDIEVEAVEE